MNEATGGGDEVLVAAVRLMRLAQPLLDRAGCAMATVQLQHAIDLAEGGVAQHLTDEEVSAFLDGGGFPRRRVVD